MSLRKLPEIKAFERPDGLQWDAPADALARWSESVSAADTTADTITIFDVIGRDYWSGEGVTAKRIDAALRSIGQKPVTVKINSPGGDMFEGLAIYNLLRAHPEKVRIEIYGIAASAASVIAMAGDEIQMGLGSFMMIHNAWGVVVGNRNDMREAATIFDQFDAAMSEIYAARTGKASSDIAKLMDAETYMRASEAVTTGFADGTFAEPASPPETKAQREFSARAHLDALLAKQGVPRSERRKLLREATGTPGAAGTASTPGAALDLAAAARLLATLKS